MQPIENGLMEALWLNLSMRQELRWGQKARERERVVSVSDPDCDSFQFPGPGPICSCLLCAALIASGQEAGLIVPV